MMISLFLVMIIMMIISLSLLAMISFLILSVTLYVKLKCLISFRRNRRRLLDWYTELLSASPSQTIVVNRLGAPRTVVTANPANVEYVLKTNFSNFPKGRPFTEILGDLLGQGIFNVDGELWSTQRKLASHEFTARSLRVLVAAVLEREVGESLVPLLEKACDGDDDGARVLDLQAVLRRFAFDVICRVSLGIEDGDACPVDLSRLVEAFDRAAEISAGRGTEPVFLVWKAKRALRVGSEKALREEVELIHKFVNKIIRQKRRALINDNRDNSDRSTSRGGDLLSRLLLAGHGEEVVRDMVISFIMAGRDTTSAAMTWLFWLLSENAETERLAVEEVKRIMEQNRKDGDSTYNALSYEGLQEMSYVKACLCEAMRLYPPVPWDSKHAANDDVLPDGTAVRRGDRVTYFPYGMGRMEEVWGKDCLEFRPDRWFSQPAAEDGGFVLKPVSPFRFPVFQAGPRVCLGKEMAFTQMKYVVGSVLSRFEIRPVGLDRPVFVPLLTAHMAGGFKVSVRRRGGQ